MLRSPLLFSAMLLGAVWTPHLGLPSRCESACQEQNGAEPDSIHWPSQSVGIPVDSPTCVAEAAPWSTASAESNPNVEPHRPVARDATPSGVPSSTVPGSTRYVLAAQPKPGDHFRDGRPEIDGRSWPTEGDVRSDFSLDPIHESWPYDPCAEINVYQGKTLNANRRPLIELGRPWYQLGQLSPGYSYLGFHNLVTPQFVVFGDFRSAYASADNGGDTASQIAFETNLGMDLRLTGTERFSALVTPLDNGRNTRILLDEERFEEEMDFDFYFGYFEGDLGSIVGGFTDRTMPFDLPFAVGMMPLIFQNGIWLEDALVGVALSAPAKNSPRLDISNMDTTFFMAWDDIDSPAFEGDNSASKIYGIANFVEAMNGYFEIDYAYLEDRNARNRSYHNIGLGYTRRYGLLSNSARIIVNAGQSTDAGPNTADGRLFILENSLITQHPQTVVPYVNLWAGFDRPQSAARAGDAGGILDNTGIVFKSDGMTGFPTLDATANDTYGGAVGLNLMANDFSQQLVVEGAALGVIGNDPARNARGDQYGLGYLYQLPLNNSLIFVSQGTYGFLRSAEDVHGIRIELRQKF